VDAAFDVRLSPTAAQKLTFFGVARRRHGVLRQWLCDFAGVFDEQPATGLSVRFFRVTIPYGHSTSSN
jgi:hypothetical protein